MCPNAARGVPVGGNRPPKPASSKKFNHGGGNGHGKAHGNPFGWLNCTNVEQVSAANGIVLGMLSIPPLHGKVLFHSRATTSFIALDFVKTMGALCHMLQQPISIISVGGSVIVTRIKMERIITIYGCMYYADLFVIP